jgi:hypothetical protein
VLDQMVNIPELLVIGGLVRNKQAGTYAVSRGAVRIEKWTIGVSEVTLPRWVLRGVTVNGRTMRISEDGYKILRNPERPMALA